MAVARYGPPDDPNNPDNEPTAYINYGDGGPGLPPGEPEPWYRKPAALVAFFFPAPIVRVVLQSGAFDAESTALVARVLQFYALAIVGESVLELVARVFYANHNSKTPMFVAIGALVLRIGLMLAWRDTLGAAGLALAYAIGVTVEATVLWFLARRNFVVER